VSGEYVIKIGGSLADIPRLGCHLRSWLALSQLEKVVFVCGGGAAADMVRQADSLDRLGEERCHWLALRCLAFTAHLLASRLGHAKVIAEIGDRESVWHEGMLPVLDLHAFALADEARPDHLPHLWSVTSDSLAARAALVSGIPSLILVKSRSVATDWIDAARAGAVDGAFPGVVAAAGNRLQVTAVNFRQWLAERASAAVPPEHEP
jgi:5-(aminomethyl)-3-furanmethanol phosphate kinase